MTQPTGRARSSLFAAQKPGRDASQSTVAATLPPGNVRRTAAARRQNAALPASPVSPTSQVSVVRRARVAEEAVLATPPPTRLQRAITRIGQRCVQLCHRSGKRGLAVFQKLAARMILRGRRGPDGAPRLRVLDQCSVAPRTRLLLVEVDGQRLLLAAAGDQAPTMLFLPPASGVRKQRGSEAKSPAGKAMSSSPRTPSMRSARTAASVDVPRWPVQPALGSEIQ